MIRTYYYLTKPGIVYGNLLTAVAGFLIGSGWQFNLITFIAMVVGIAFVMASGCVFNNVLDRKIDSKTLS